MKETSGDMISVVMPAYNAARYIAESIECIIAQDYVNFELVICDDCSTDNTAEIVSGYTDSRIRLIRTEHNTGSAKYPREMAIEAANGNLICWIDSDDLVPSDYLTKLYNRKLETSADIVCSQMLAVRDGVVEYTLPRGGFDYSVIHDGKETMMMTLGFPWQINLNGWLCDKRLWTSVSSFKNLSIIHMDADDYSAREILYNARKVAFSQAEYRYRIHSNSITKKIGLKRFESIITDFLVYDFVKTRFTEAKAKVQLMMCQRMISLTRLFVVNHNYIVKEEIKSIDRLLSSYHRRIPTEIAFDNQLSIGQRLLLLLPYPASKKLIQFLN